MCRQLWSTTDYTSFISSWWKFKSNHTLLTQLTNKFYDNTSVEPYTEVHTFIARPRTIVSIIYYTQYQSENIIVFIIYFSLCLLPKHYNSSSSYPWLMLQMCFSFPPLCILPCISTSIIFHSCFFFCISWFSEFLKS